MQFLHEQSEDDLFGSNEEGDSGWSANDQWFSQNHMLSPEHVPPPPPDWMSNSETKAKADDAQFAVPHPRKTDRRNAGLELKSQNSFKPPKTDNRTVKNSTCLGLNRQNSFGTGTQKPNASYLQKVLQTPRADPRICDLFVTNKEKYLRKVADSRGHYLEVVQFQEKQIATLRSKNEQLQQECDALKSKVRKLKQSMSGDQLDIYEILEDAQNLVKNLRSLDFRGHNAIQFSA